MAAWKLKVTDIIASGDSVRCFVFVAPTPEHTYQRAGELSLTFAEAQDLKARFSDSEVSVAEIRAQALEEAAQGLGWLGAQGNVPEPDTAWAGVTACREILLRLAKEERGKA